MTRLLVHVEGETEEDFIKEVLGPHLYELGFWSVKARLIGNARLRARRGGIRSWQVIRKDIVRNLSEDPKLFAALMVDYYRLPQTGIRAWPGRAEAATHPIGCRSRHVESALRKDLIDFVGDDSLKCRFIPCVVMHEFEALLFSDCEQLAAAMRRPDLMEPLQAIRDQFDSPESIDDSPITAPSKRLIGLNPYFHKRIEGINAARHIGLEIMRGECPSFSNWIDRLESLAEGS